MRLARSGERLVASATGTRGFWSCASVIRRGDSVVERDAEVLPSLRYLGVTFAVVATGTYGSDAIDRVAVATVLGDSLGVSAKAVAACAAAVISLGTANAFVAATSRLGYALGRDDVFPRAIGRLDRRGVPTVGVFCVAPSGRAD
jgi:hypothetical protein